MTVLVNKTTTPVSVFYYDASNREQQTTLNPGKQFVVNGAIHPSTQALIKAKVLAVTSSSTPDQRSYTLAFGTPLVWAQGWRLNATYKAGFVVLYNGKTFVAVQDHVALNPPAEEDPRWELLSLKSFAAAFDFLVTVADDGALISYDATHDEWILAKLTDANVQGISASKITDMDAVFASLIPSAGGTMTGQLALVGNPTENLHAAPKQYVDGFLSKAGGTMAGDIVLAGNPTSALHATPKQYVDTFLPLAGGTLTGPITLSGAPTDSLHAASKQYVDGFLPLAGGTMAGFLSLSGNPTQNLHAAPKQYVDTFLPKAGGTLTGALTLSGAPTQNLHAATKQYVDGFLPLAGGTMSGFLSLSGAPTLGAHATTKTYVDGFLSKAGGVMIGAITGSHGLLPLSGGTMTGPIVLPTGDPTNARHAAHKQYVDARLLRAGDTLTGQLNLLSTTLNAGTGLYEASDYGVPAWKSGLLQVNYPATYLTTSYVAVAGTGTFVFRGFQESTLDLHTNAPFPNRVMTVSNDGQANLYVVGQSETVVLAPGETLSLLPSGLDFIVVSRGTVPDVGASLAVASVGSEVAGTKNVTFSLYDVTKATTAISLVENPSVGVLRFTVSDASNIQLGSKIFVTGTSIYDGEYLVHAISGSLISVQTNTPFTTTRTGSMGVVRLTSRSTTLALLALVSDTVNAWDGAAGAAMSMVSGGVFQARSPAGNGYRLDGTGGSLVLNLDEQYDGYRILYVHLLTVGRSTPVRSTLVSDVAKLTLNIVAGTNNGGLLQLELASVAGFQSGDVVTLAGTGTAKDGNRTISDVLTGPPRIRLITSYTAVSTGTVTNNQALLLTVTETAGLAVNDYVYLKNLPCLGAQRITKQVLGTTDTTIIIKDFSQSFDAALGKVGVAEQACITQVEFLENSSSSSSSSSIRSSQSSASSVNSSSSSSFSSLSSNSSSSSSSSSP